MTTTEIHVPISLNRPFATQTELLVRSIAQRACLPGDWRVVLTVSRDTTEPLNGPLMRWTRDFPVTLEWCDPALWQRHHWGGTGLHMHLHAHAADVTLFMDADTVVVGSLAELVESVARDPVVAGWPAWKPPENADLDHVLRECGIGPDYKRLRYSGYGLAFESPRDCPPYFNLGFLAVNGEIARDMKRTMPPDFEEVNARFETWFISQVAVCVNVLRHGYPYRALDIRYNASNGAWDPASPPPFDSADSAAIVAAMRSMVDDVRVMHYNVEHEDFNRRRDMDGMARVRAFCERSGLDNGCERLQRALRPLLPDPAPLPA